MLSLPFFLKTTGPYGNIKTFINAVMTVFSRLAARTVQCIVTSNNATESGDLTIMDRDTGTLKERYSLLGLFLAAVVGLGLLRLQGPTATLAFHRYLVGDFRLANLSAVGLLLILLPGVLLWPLIGSLAARGTGAVRAWKNVVVVSGWHILYGVVILQGLGWLAPLPTPSAQTVYTALAASLAGAFLNAGWGLCFWLVTIGLVQLRLAITHPKWARWCPLSIMPLLPVVVGLSTVSPVRLTPAILAVIAVAPVVIVLAVGGVFGIIVSYVDHMSRRKNEQQKTATSV